MTGTKTRGMASTTLAFAAVVLMLTIARNAGLEGAAPIGFIMVAGAVVLALLILMVLLHALRTHSPQEQFARLLMETMGMLTVATPVVFLVALYAGWI